MIEVYMTFESEKDCDEVLKLVREIEGNGEFEGDYSIQTQVVDDIPWGG
jgi:hypothetical protein